MRSPPFHLAAITRIAQMVWQRPWLVLLASVLVTAAVASGARHLQMNSDYKVFFSDENPQLRDFEALQARFTKDDNIFIAIEPAEGTVFTGDRLSAIEGLVGAAWTVPFATRVDALTNYQHTRSEGDDLFVDDLIYGASAMSDAEIAQVRRIALSEPTLVNRLVSPDGDFTAINLTLKLPGEAVGEEFAAITRVRELAAEFEQQNPDLKVHLTGMVMLFGGFSEVMQRDMGTLMPLMIVTVLLIVGLITRSITGTLASLAVMIFSVLVAMGFGGFVGIPFTAPIASVPTMIMTLAVANCVHILVATLAAMRRGLSKKAAIGEALRLNATPVVITSVTTAIGFLSMNFSEVPPFRDLGNMTAVGVLAACAYSLTAFPALLALLPMRVRVHESVANSQSRLDRLGEFVVSRSRPLLWASASLAVVLALFATRNELNDEMVKFLDERIEFRQDTDHVAENLTGIYTIEYSLGAREGSVTDPEYLRAIEAFRGWMAHQPHVLHVSSFDQVTKRINRAMHGGAAAAYRIPDDPQASAQYLLLYELSLPYGLDLNNQINVDRTATRFTATVNNMGSEDLIALAEAGEMWMEQNAPLIEASHGISTPLIFAHLVRRQIHSMIAGAVVALILITIVLAGVFRSVKYGAVSLIPNLLPLVAAFGIWGMTRAQINGGLAIVFGMTLGIIVDDTVHFTTKFIRGIREQGLSPEDAARYAFSSVAKAVITTSAALAVGFVVLAQSSFGLFFDMARLTVIAILLALVFDLFFLPGLLIRVARADRARRPAASSSTIGAHAMPLIFLLVTIATLLPVNVAAQSNRGLEIAREADRRDSGWVTSEVRVRMTLRNQHGEQSERFLRNRSLEVEGDGDKTLVIFDEPADVRGTAVLTYAHRTSADDQWLYLPSLARVKRLATSNKAGPFMGSEFAFEDIASREVEKYTYAFVREEALNGVAAFVVEQDPVDPRSGYTRQLAWYDTEHYRPLKVEYYDRRNELLKTLVYEDYRSYVNGRFWRPRRMLMTNHQTGKSTIIEYQDYAFSTGLTERDFEVAALRNIR